MARTEIDRLMFGADEGAKPGGLGTVRFVVQCRDDAQTVLSKCREVLEIVLRNTQEPWPALAEWQGRLPNWFVERCAQEIPREEADRRVHTLTLEQRKHLLAEEGWSLSAWLHWFKPNERQWWWWDASILDESTILAAVEVRDWPFPWGALEWLFLASGALRVKPES